MFGDGTEGPPAVAKFVGEVWPLWSAALLVQRAAERLLDMEYEPALRCVERLRKQIEQDSFEHFVPSSE